MQRPSGTVASTPESSTQFPSGNIELRRNARGTPSALSSSESYV